MLLLLCIAAWAVWWSIHRTAAQHHPRYAQEIQSTEGASAFELPGVFTLDYLDKGETVEIGILTQADPVLYVDVNQNGLADTGDRSYAADGESPCVRGAGAGEEYAPCNNVPTHAVVHSRQSGNMHRVTWIIPKAELLSTGNGADIAIEIFHPLSQRGEIYPDKRLFQHVFHLAFIGWPAFVPSAEAMPSRAPASPAAPASVPSAGKPLPPAPSSAAAGGQKPPSIPPLIDTFEAASQNIPFGSGVKLDWSVSHAESVDIEPGVGMVPSAGEQTITPTQTTLYTLTAKGAGGASSRQLTISVQPAQAPQVESFLSDAGTVAAGGTVRLSWSVTGDVTKITLTPGFDGLPPKGERTVTVGQTTDYVLAADGPGGHVTAKLTVRAEIAAPAIILQANPNNLHPGDATTLQWSVTGADRIALYPAVGAVAATGSIVLRPIRDIRYTLTAQGPGGTSVADVTVFVTHPAGASSGQIVWSGVVHGSQLVSIDGNHADVGQLQGALPGLPCIVQPADEKNVSIASTPGPRNNYTRLVLRVKGKGFTKVVLNWSLQ
ncbi:hypothetical protein [Paracidobacterium acidisoli]|uniref:Uncharacterized protein n=1 Tax=Paracidobacterium acidisoli TaxID=2303751 RepID=A0A372IJ24_9BACT|nr:hypothetical protein [Paracidobacterium acidisoli]MBT9333143.1 hypothetical protein [Paracidobacterium acidisoli]